uniref:Membrane insertase YidC/Oxa/ALB C-terminal domain-containing protein n=1 Tax=Panagrolaimus sp. JU765 TaxID=591449 RepID=A0AC34QRQ0_9BILA
MLSVLRKVKPQSCKNTTEALLKISARNYSGNGLINLKISFQQNGFCQIRNLSSHDVGQSVLEELGLFSYWKPSSYVRMALESLHLYCDMPWWGAIMAATVALRLMTIFVPIMSQKLVAKQSQYKPELDGFRKKLQDAQAEGNNLAVQQVLLEQRSFMVSKDIKLGRQLLVMLGNGVIFATQFFAIRGMANVNYPGFSTGGIAWFMDLTSVDPLYLLPIISAATLHLVLRVGVEMGTSADQMTPAMKLGMLYGLPVVVLISSMRFSSAICLYWTTSNVISLIYAGMFNTPVIRKLFGIPPVIRYPVKEQPANAWKQALAQYKAKRSAAPSLNSIREKDAEMFRKAGRAKPIQKD